MRVLQNPANRRDAPWCIRSPLWIVSGCTRVQPYNLTEIVNFDTPSWQAEFSSSQNLSDMACKFYRTPIILILTPSDATCSCGATTWAPTITCSATSDPFLPLSLQGHPPRRLWLCPTPQHTPNCRGSLAHSYAAPAQKQASATALPAAEALYMGVSGEFYFISLRTWSPALMMNTPLPAKRISEFARPSATRLPAAL